MRIKYENGHQIYQMAAEEMAQCVVPVNPIAIPEYSKHLVGGYSHLAATELVLPPPPVRITYEKGYQIYQMAAEEMAQCVVPVNPIAIPEYSKHLVGGYSHLAATELVLPPPPVRITYEKGYQIYQMAAEEMAQCVVPVNPIVIPEYSKHLVDGYSHLVATELAIRPPSARIPCEKGRWIGIRIQ